MSPRRIWLAAIAAVVLTTVAAAPSPAASPKPVRSGTITGWAVTWPAMFSGEARDCQWSEWDAGANPECAAWLHSGCSRDLAGRDPAVTASIENVSTLADGTTPRVFAWRATSSPANVLSGGVVVQLWRKDCTEIEGAEWRSRDWLATGDSRRWNNRKHTAFVLPRDAAWMTVTTNDTANLTWTLR